MRGTIVGKHMVITAAHCTEGRDASRMTVCIGSHANKAEIKVSMKICDLPLDVPRRFYTATAFYDEIQACRGHIYYTQLSYNPGNEILF